jgi:hypothetical protein
MKRIRMNIRTVILAIILATASCTSQTTVNYADSLKGCLTDEDISLLNEACQTFEIKKYVWPTMGIKHRADSGFRKFSALSKLCLGGQVKCSEMPYVSYPRPLAASRINE